MTRSWIVAITVGALACAPTLFVEGASVAHAQAKRDYWVKDFEQNYAKWTQMLDDQIARNKVYPSDIKRAQDALTHALEGLTRDGHDPAPYKARMATYFGTVQQRVDAAAMQGRRDAVSKKVPLVKPGPGVQTIPEGAPAWCGDLVAKMAVARRGAPSSLDLKTYASDLKIEDIQTAALMACEDPSFAPVLKWSQAYRQHLSNLTGFTVAQNDALMAYAARAYQPPQAQGYQGRPNVGGLIPDVPRCAKHPVKEGGLAEERLTRHLERTLLSCKGGTNLGFEISTNLRFGDGLPYWVIDTQAGATTELARAGLVRQLLLNRVYTNALSDPGFIKNPEVLIQNYAVARTVPLDQAALERELVGLGLDEALTWELRFRSYEIHQAMRNVEAFTQAWLAANPEYKPVVIDGPEAAVAQNRKEAAASKPLIDMILAIEDRIDPKQAGGLNGCAEALYEPFAQWLKARVKHDKVTGADELTFDDYRGSLLVYGLYFCGLNDAGAPGLASALQEKFGRTLVQHGPLSAAYAGMLAAFNEVQQRKSTAKSFSATRRGDAPTIDFSKLTWNPVSRPQEPRDLFAGTNISSFTGVIKSAKKDGDRVVVTFNTLKYRVPTFACKDTNRISYIQDNGLVHYQQSCVKTGTREVKETNDPVSMPAFVAAGLKPGMSMTYRGTTGKYTSENGKGTLRQGWPVEVYKSKAQKALVALYGVWL